jgi:arylsulfatase A-like enzyme
MNVFGLKLAGLRGWVLARSLLLGLCLSHAALAQAPALAAVKRPHIVLIVADDWGFTDLGAFGGEISTPHLDALAMRGVRFSNFHTAGSCSPTRAMLLTGVQSHKAGVGNLKETTPRSHKGKPGYLGSMSRNVVTFASLLQEGGYRTYVSGKWNVGSEPYNLPPQRGFHRSIVQGDTGSDNWDPRQRYLPFAAKVDWFEDGRPADMPKEFYSSTYFVDRLMGFIKDDGQRKSDQPFMAYLAFQANHVPIQAPQQFIDKYKGKYAQGWDVLREQRNKRAGELGIVPKDTAMVRLSTTLDWSALSEKDRALQQRQMEIYAAMAEAMDHEVGRLIAFLKARGEYDNTVFVFLSDNGSEGSDYAAAQPWLFTQYSQALDRLGGKGAYGIPGPSWASAQASPLKGYKFFAGEGGIRVPMFMTLPQMSRTPGIESGLTHVTDVAPTLLALAGLAPQGAAYQGQRVEPMSGKSLMPLLEGKASTVRGPHESLGYELSGNKVLFRGDFKLVSNLAPIGDGQWQLFNLREDPGETRDLKAQMPDLFQSMQRDYEAYAQANGILPMPAGYEPRRQATINSIFSYWLPAYAWHYAAAMAALLAWWVWRRRKAQSKRFSGA